MRNVRHILLPTDLSENSQTAFPAAVSWARRSDAVVHLLHVVGPPSSTALRVAEQHGVPRVALEIRRDCEERLREISARLGDGVRCELHVVDGSPAEEVGRFVTERNVDLIALSTQGRTGFERFRLGSTTEKIVRTAPCPVLVVRPVPRSWDSLTTIVVPTDFSPLSRLAAQEAAELARPHGARLVLVHVLQETDYPIGRVLEGHGILGFREQVEHGARLQLEDMQADQIGDSVTSTIVVREGAPSVTIASLAEEERADVVVIATHGREGVARFVLGSTAERVVRIAPCSVLVVKERDG